MAILWPYSGRIEIIFKDRIVAKPNLPISLIWYEHDRKLTNLCTFQLRQWHYLTGGVSTTQ